VHFSGVLKPYSEFYSWKNKNGEINHKNLCKTCEIVKGNIYKSVKKIKCIITSFPKPCSNCEIDDAFIPVFNFHHLNPKLKKEGWAKINGKGIDYILNWIKREQVISLCNNCHNKIHSKYLNQDSFREIILDPELFLKSGQELRQIVKDKTQYLKEKKTRANIQGKIFEWIKKRFVIETLIGNHCPGCGLTVLDNLGAFEMHHINPELKKSKWHQLENKTIPQILRGLVDEQCIWLCSICHSLITSNFEERAKETFELIYSHEQVAKKLKLVEERFLKINTAVKNYKPNVNDFDYDPLFYVHQDNIWKYNFIKLHELYPFSFQTKDFRDNICKNYKPHMLKYKKFGLVEHIYSDYKKRGYYKYTNKGIGVIGQFQKDIDRNTINRKKRKKNEFLC